MKNADLRSIGQSQGSGGDEGGGSVLNWLLALLLIAVPAGGIYAWRSGMLSRGPAAPVQQAAPASAAPAIVAEAKAAPVAAQPAPARPVDMRDANDALTRGLTIATRENKFTFMISGSDYQETLTGLTDKDGRINKVVNPNDLFAYCAKQSESLAKSRIDRSKKFDAGTAMIMTSEVLLCGLMRGGKQLCEPKTRDHLVKQVGFYNDLRDGALTALANDKPAQELARAALNAGAHREIRLQLKKLATDGILSVADFGYFPSTFVSETVGEVKGAKKACVRT